MIIGEHQRIGRSVFFFCFFRAFGDEVAHRGDLGQARFFDGRKMLAVGDAAAADDRCFEGRHNKIHSFQSESLFKRYYIRYAAAFQVPRTGLWVENLLTNANMH